MSVDLRFVTRICVHRKTVGLTRCHSTICAQNYARPRIQKTAHRKRINILIVQVPVRAKGLHWRCRVQESSLCNCWPLESDSESYIHQDYHTQNFRIMITTAAITEYIWNSASWVLRYPSDSQWFPVQDGQWTPLQPVKRNSLVVNLGASQVGSTAWTCFAH
jgi:hypothetical protein